MQGTRHLWPHVFFRKSPPSHERDEEGEVCMPYSGREEGRRGSGASWGRNKGKGGGKEGGRTDAGERGQRWLRGGAGAGR